MWKHLEKTVANETTKLIGFNSNGNLDTQLGIAQSWVMNSTAMKGAKSIILFSHKPCSAPPNMHHPIDSKVKTFCDSLISKIPSNIRVFIVSGHNHVLAQSKDKTWYVSGAGGRSHYSCGMSIVWPYCNNSAYGFLELNIQNNGSVFLVPPHSKGVIIR